MGLGTVLILFFWVFIIFLIFFVRRHLIHRKQLSAIPSCRSLPFIGHVLIIRPDVEGFVDQIMGMAKIFPKAPRIITFWAGTIASVMIYSPEHVSNIFTNSAHLNKGMFYDFLKPWLGFGLLTSNSVAWKPRRKLLTPTFHYDILKNFAHTFNTQSDILIKKINKLLPGTFNDIGFLVSLCALDIICETSMGQTVNAQSEENSDYVRAVLRINDIIQRRQKNPLMWNNLLFWLFGDGREHKWAINILRSFTKKVIAERRKRKQEDSMYLSENRLAFLDLLLEMEQNGDIKENDIQEEVDTFMFEGHDTTATGITWALQMLGNHHDLQEKVFLEIQKVCGDSIDVTLDQLSQLKYLECFIKETLRLYPSVPIIARRFGSDGNIGGYFVPKDTQILLNIYLIHRDPDHWEDPEVFNPDSKGRHPFAYIPFSAGNRNCIGQRFALMEEKIMLTHIIRKFYIKSLQRRDLMRHKIELILRPLNGVGVKLTPRDS